MNNRSFISVVITAFLVGFSLLLRDTLNQTISSSVSGLFSIGSLLFILGLGGLLYILLLPSYGLIERKFKSSTFSFKLLIYIVIALILSTIITLVVEREFSLNLQVTLVLVISFILFALLSKKKLKLN